ncbi:MAG: response regulator transcription factor, partial [Acidobacteria bacterium]|nr:response regulator transcription factor [Acidobacteriota bacterium]
MSKPVVLVIDDEPQILRVMRASLPIRGYEVITASSGEEALDQLSKQVPDLVILDLVMPEISGLELCRRIREFSSVPIIVLSAKGSESDKVAALDLGADDYVTKPFGMDELLARARAVLRRLPTSSNDRVLTVGDVTIDIDERRVVVARKEIRLTPKEFDVLKYLVSKAGKVVTHRALLQTVWGWQSTEQTEYLRVFINQLRRKIEIDASHPRYIVTEPWVGY